MRDDTQLTQEERYQIEALLQTGRQHSKIVRYENVLASRLQISYLSSPDGELHLRVESARENNRACRQAILGTYAFSGGTSENCLTTSSVVFPRGFNS
jgi:hypothetical protein